MISSAAARTVTVVVAWLQVVLLAAGSAEAKCLSSGGPRADKRKLNVHLISHAHDDVGWLKTVDQYFYGQRNDFQHASVGNALDTIVQSLEVNPDRRFTFAEQAFFQRWWNEQNDERRNVTRQLVASGQLSFVLNGWAQHGKPRHARSIIAGNVWASLHLSLGCAQSTQRPNPDTKPRSVVGEARSRDCSTKAAMHQTKPRRTS